jgi:hypothetical protein
MIVDELQRQALEYDEWDARERERDRTGDPDDCRGCIAGVLGTPHTCGGCVHCGAGGAQGHADACPAVPPVTAWRIVETDHMTGNQREWTVAGQNLTTEEADALIERNKTRIVGRYSYRKVPQDSPRIEW